MTKRRVTSSARNTDTHRGGHPSPRTDRKLRYTLNMTRYSVNDLPARLRDRIVIDGDTGCWIVQNSRPRSDTPSEYRGISYSGQLWQTHVLAYTLLIGPIPAGLTIDHVWDRGCRSKACCNPGHLEAVTTAENNRRRIAARWNRLPATGEKAVDMSADTLAALVAERDWVMGLLNVPGVTVDDVPEGLGEFTYRTPSGLYRVKIEPMAEGSQRARPGTTL